MKFTGIRFRLLLLGIIPIFVLTSALAYYFINNQIRSLETSLNERGDIITRQLATAGVYGVFSGNHQILQELVDTVLLEKDVVWVKFSDLQNDVLAQAQLPTLPEEQSLRDFSASVILQPLASNEEMFFYPAETTSPKKIGGVTIKLSLRNTLSNQHTTLINGLFISIIGLVITAAIAIRLGYTISLPIIKLTQAVNDISMGNLSTRANFKAKDEIEDLRRGFNVMAIGMEQTHQYLENQVDHATSRLRKTLDTLENKNLSLEKSKDLAIAQNEIKSQFIAHISHEIRTPMNGILGFTDLLLKSDLNLKQIDRLQLIRSSAINLLSIVNEILELASLESGNFSLNFKFFDLRSCLEDAVSLFSANNNKIELILDVNSDIPQRINNDATRLQQIITNLLNNANKFTHHGHIIIRCRLITDHSQQKSLLITISDTGIGISKIDQARLFAPFLQLSEFAINREQGTGLGLSICKNIIERMQGEIGVVSAEDIGSTFWINLPCNTNKLSTQAPSGMNIVVIIAHSISRRAFKKQLINLGHRVYSYASVASFSAADCGQFDLIFIDTDLNKHQNLAEFAATHFKDANEQCQKIITLIRDNKPSSLPSDATTLNLPSRSNYLSTLIKSQLEIVNNAEPRTDDSPHQATEKQYAILIADDNEINRLLLKSQFEDHFHYLDLAKNGREAFEYITNTAYDLILLDLQMPELTGIELIKKIKTPQCRNANTLIIAITAHAQIDQRQKVIESGFDDCLIKPILPKQLASVIETCLHKKLTKSAAIDEQKQQQTDFVEIMLAKTKNDKELATNLFTKLFEEMPGQILVIKQACAEDEVSLAIATTHKLLGSASFCGLSEIQNAARNLEMKLTNNNLTELFADLCQLENKVDSFLSDKPLIMKKLQV